MGGDESKHQGWRIGDMQTNKYLCYITRCSGLADMHIRRSFANSVDEEPKNSVICLVTLSSLVVADGQQVYCLPYWLVI